MRWGIGMALAGLLVWPAVAAAQGSGGMRVSANSTSGVIRPAGYVWRNYVTVPDGPCGPPMSVQADCYVPCRPCGPLHPFCFLHRVGRMLSCLVPCNHCCHRGGCGLHGCVLGGRWGGCGVCCGRGCDPCCEGGWMGPAGGGHCLGCGGPAASDPFQDDPVPAPPPAPSPSETRYPGSRPLPMVGRAASGMGRPAAAMRQPAAGGSASHAPAVYRAPAGAVRQADGGSVLRRTGAAYEEPIRLRPDLRAGVPVIRSQSPEETDGETSPAVRPVAALIPPPAAATAELGEPVPYNPLRP